MNNGIAIALSAAFIQAISHTVLKKSYQDQPPSVAYLIDALFGMLIWIPFTLFLGVDLTSLIQVLPYALLSAVLAEAYVFYILSKGTLSLTNTVFYTYPMFTIIISRFVNHESLTPSQLGAVLIILIGILIMSFPKKIKRDELKHIFTLLWPLSAAFTVGISDSMSKNIITQTSPETFLFCLALAQLPIATIYYVIETKSSPHKLVFLKQLKYPLIASFLMVCLCLPTSLNRLTPYWHCPPTRTRSCSYMAQGKNFTKRYSSGSNHHRRHYLVKSSCWITKHLARPGIVIDNLIQFDSVNVM